jgi:type IV pilus assembly protein PilV
MSIKPSKIIPVKVISGQNSHIKKCHINNSRGFTLLEALIGFLILSIGMLGIASLQAVSLQAGKTSVYGSVAMMKVDELFESMRANSSAAALLVYDTVGEGAGTNNNCSGTTVCSVAQLAQDDVFWWKKNLKAGLPGAATAQVIVADTIPASKLQIVTVNIIWSERNKDTAEGAASSVSKTYTTTASICTVIPC